MSKLQARAADSAGSRRANSRRELSISEVQLHRELEKTRIAGGGDPSEVSGASGSGNTARFRSSHADACRALGSEVGVVDYIECFAADFEPESFVDSKDAAQGNIELQLAGEAQNIPSQVAESPWGIRGE